MEGAQAREHECTHPLSTRINIHTPLLDLWSSLGTKDVKGRGRESQANVYKLHSKKDGSRKMSGVLTTGLVKNKESVDS